MRSWMQNGQSFRTSWTPKRQKQRSRRMQCHPRPQLLPLGFVLRRLTAQPIFMPQRPPMRRQMLLAVPLHLQRHRTMSRRWMVWITLVDANLNPHPRDHPRPSPMVLVPVPLPVTAYLSLHQAPLQLHSLQLHPSFWLPCWRRPGKIQPTVMLKGWQRRATASWRSCSKHVAAAARARGSRQKPCSRCTGPIMQTFQVERMCERLYGISSKTSQQIGSPNVEQASSSEEEPGAEPCAEESPRTDDHVASASASASASAAAAPAAAAGSSPSQQQPLQSLAMFQNSLEEMD
mmetsp:Transcript_67860/g.141840  ORF Transcript_67860/g.141840 Transcript_67860/m.141840 type:complete len:290 (+) Transcript_67860:1284-2153(+)